MRLVYTQISPGHIWTTLYFAVYIPILHTLNAEEGGYACLRINDLIFEILTKIVLRTYTRIYSENLISIQIGKTCLQLEIKLLSKAVSIDVNG